MKAHQAVTPEDYLDYAGLEYRVTAGSRGTQLNIETCPRCGSNDWKVYLNQESGYGNCFKCAGENGYNLWTFVGAVLGTDNGSAIAEEFKRVAKTIGWRPPARKTKKRVVQVPENFDLPSCISLPTSSGKTLAYLADRGINERLCRHFDLRYCSVGYYEYEKEGEARKMNFDQRVIIPIRDLDGKMVTFQGRDITGESDRKYLFPPTRPATARFLYNGDNALKEGARHIVMGEGSFDVMAIQRALWSLAEFSHIIPVGTWGKKLTLSAGGGEATQLQALLQLREAGLKTITIMWDGESEALASALKAARELKKYEFNVRIAFLPLGKDPGEIHDRIILKSIEKAKPYSRSLELKCAAKRPYG